MMIPMPMIQIRTQPIKLDIRSELGHYNIKTHPPKLNMSTTPSRMEFYNPPAKLEIDSTKAWEAFHGGSLLSLTRRIYSQIPSIVQQVIRQKTAEGERLSAVHLPGNAIKELAVQSLSKEPIPLRYMGTPSSDNIDIRFTSEDFRMDFR